MKDDKGKYQNLNKAQYVEHTKTTMENSIRKMFDGGEGADTWKIEFDLRVVTSAKDIKRSDHVFNLTDNVAPWPGKAKIGGSIINILPFLADLPGAEAPSHEVGHSLGLRHINPADAPKGGFGTGFSEGTDKDNDILGLKSTNIMGYAEERTPFEGSQIKRIRDLIDAGNINDYSDKDVADPYYENHTLRQEVLDILKEIKK